MAKDRIRNTLLIGLPNQVVGEIQDLLFKSEINKAAMLYSAKAGTSESDSMEIVLEEIEHLAINECRKHTIELSPRQAFVYATLCGWCGDEPSVMPYPPDRETLIAWSRSHLNIKCDADTLRSAFEELCSEGFFFEVHPGVFEVPGYYCSYNCKYLSEVPFGIAFQNDWIDLRKKNDSLYGAAWLQHGLCLGQGSQSGSSWGPCKGKDCIWIQDGKKECNWGLKYI